MDLVFDLKVHEVLAGDVAGHHLSVKVRRFESVAGDELSWLGKGAKVILFLKEAQPWEGRGWISVDMWFGVQPANRAMARSLKRLAAEGEANEAAMAEGVVLSFNDGIVEISLGSDDGIQAGQELYWRRGLRELGRLKVLSATAERAAAEVDRRFDRKLRNPHRNDRVLTRLIPPKPAPTTRQKN
ncbi:MAG TPA: hypothetical protein PK867_19300 [Pirellulales bacterium]|nr:hypothetical protein [Pirellulales bacterium]